MRNRIAEKGIFIECNPTSNRMISPFKFYDEHPILLFNNYKLSVSKQDQRIPVSINTDDLGVFGTSLESEFAKMLCALKRRGHLTGDYNNEEIYDYLDYIRENGFIMSFAPTLKHTMTYNEYWKELRKGQVEF